MRDVTKSMTSRIIWGGACGALALLAGGAAAQTAPGGAAASDSELQTIVVTAQRRAEDIQSVPITIQAFTGKDLADLGVKSSSDLGQFAANVEIALPSGAGNQPLISIRGIGLNDYDTNNAGPNGVYLDEVYLSSPASQTFATFDMQGVEILKGPQGTLYGRNTSGGAINLTTVKPSDDFSSYLHAELGSYDTANLQGAVGGPVSSTLDGRVAFDYNYSEGYMHNLLTGDHENGANNYAARGMLLWKPTGDLKVLFNVHAGQVNNRPVQYRHIGDLDPASFANPNGPQQCQPGPTYAGQCVDLFGYGTPANFYDGAYNRQQHLRVTNAGSFVRVEYDAGAVQFVSLTSAEYNMKLHPEDTDVSPNRLLEINYGVHATSLSQEFRASQNRDSYNWVAGLYFMHEHLYQNQPLFALLDGDSIVGVPGAFDGTAFRAFDTSNQNTDAYAAFGQGEYALTDKLRLVLGGRVTQEHRNFLYSGSIQPQEGGEDNFGPVIPLATDYPEHLSNGAFSWRAGLNYKFTQDVLAYASAATGFKSGDFNGSFLSTVPAEIQRQLVPVSPEHVRAYEVGLKSTLFDRHLLIDAAAFYNDYRDMQVFILINGIVGGSGLPLNVLDNAPKAHTQGLDLTLTARPTQNFTATLQAGILQAKLDQYQSTRQVGLPDYSGNQLPMAPHASGSLLLEYRVPIGADALVLQANANYKSHVFFDVSNDPYIQQGGYWLGNMRAAYDLGSRWEFGAFVHNVTNKQYYSDKFDLSQPFGFIQGIVGTPRMAGVEANWRY